MQSLILDLDGTLLESIPWEDSIVPSPDFCFEDRDVYLRPGLADFLQFCFRTYRNVGIWTAAGGSYAQEIARGLPIPSGFLWAFIWDRTKCREMPNGLVVKDLRRVWRNKRLQRMGFARASTLIIEDNPSTCIFNYGNAVYVNSFRCFQTWDRTLLRLSQYLLTLLPKEDLRTIEKRHWKFYSASNGKHDAQVSYLFASEWSTGRATDPNQKGSKIQIGFEISEKIEEADHEAQADKWAEIPLVPSSIGESPHSRAPTSLTPTPCRTTATSRSA